MNVFVFRGGAGDFILKCVQRCFSIKFMKQESIRFAVHCANIGLFR